MIDAHKIAAVLGLPPLPSQSSETIAALTWAREGGAEAPSYHLWC